jgi:uncharacterized protein with GYD domain
MPTYVVLAQFTDQGLRDLGNFVSRARENQARLQAANLKITGPYLTMGEYDQVAIIEAPDELTALRALVGILGQGNIRTRTLHAYTLDEAAQALSGQTG